MNAEAGPADDGRADDGTGADPWPQLYPPSARWTLWWRAEVALVVVAAVALAVRHAVRGDLPPWGWVLVGVGALHVARASTLVWKRATQPRLRRSDVAVLNPAAGASDREKLDQQMRLAVKERAPLTPEVHRTAALAVAFFTRTQPWYPAFVGLFGVLVIAVVGPGSDLSNPFNLLVYAFTAACYLPLFTDEHRIRRAAEAAGAVPAQLPDSGVEMP